MEEYKKEYESVKKELEELEDEIEMLLQRQSTLHQRKSELEGILQQHSSKSAADDTKWKSSDFSWSKELLIKLRDVFGMQKLRPMQLQTMNVTMSNEDCILIMPTGGGKSLCFQLPAVLSKGITLVVSPLVSLMEDQVMALENFNVDAVMLNAAASKEKVKAVQEAMTDKNAYLKLLYVTPEKLAKSKRFMAKLEKMYSMGRFSRLVIDEVHCCSQWGHDFRPDYKFLGIMKRQFPGVPILGLTATATMKVIEDVKKILNLPHCLLFKASFNRPNLYYEVREKKSVQNEVMDDIQRLIRSRFSNQSGIVYCFSRKESEDVTVELQKRGIKAGCYHADLTGNQRSQVHKMWLDDKIHVVVATVAFGMGIDKPNVRFVIHHSLSKSMENLYQESGRAGRDDLESHCIVFYRFADVFRQSTMVFTEQTGLDNLYGIMSYCTDASQCRRSIIASHFGEVWDRSHCNQMCDHCKDNSSDNPDKRDVTRLCQNVITILDQARSTEQKITAIKLMDAWLGKGASSLKVKDLDVPNISRDKLERIVATMLLHGYIQEDFHFTPYSTISYLVPGSKAALLRKGSAKVSMEFPKKQSQSQSLEKTSSKSSSSSSSSSKTSKKQNVTEKKPKPKLVIVKSQRSNSPGEKGLNSNGSFSKQGRENDHQKRKRPIITDSDSDDLDFGEDFQGEPAVKKKFSDSSSRDSYNIPSTSSFKGQQGQRSDNITGNDCDLWGDSDSDLEILAINGSDNSGSLKVMSKNHVNAGLEIASKNTVIIDSDDSEG